MKIIYLLLIVCLGLATAKYLPNESASATQLRRQLRSIEDDSAVTNEDKSENDDDSDDDTSEEGNIREQLQKAGEAQQELLRKQEEQKRKQDEKIEKEERKRQEKIEKEERKRQDRQEKEERKLQERIDKEKRKQEEAVRKQLEKIEKEERKRQEKLRKQLEELENDTVEENKIPDTSSESLEVEESNKSLDLEDIWKNHIYAKYGLLVNSTDLEKKVALNKYMEEELGLNVNSTKSERRLAVIQLIQNNSNTESGSQDAFRNYMLNHINAVAIHQLRAKLEDKIAKLNNKSGLLENSTMPWVPEAKQTIDEKRTLIQSVLQFLSQLLPNWATGGQASPSVNSNTTAISQGNSGSFGSASPDASSLNTVLESSPGAGSSGVSESGQRPGADSVDITSGSNSGAAVGVEVSPAGSIETGSNPSLPSASSAGSTDSSVIGGASGSSDVSSGSIATGGNVATINGDNTLSVAAGPGLLDPATSNVESANAGGLPSAEVPLITESATSGVDKPIASVINSSTSNTNSVITGASDVSSATIQESASSSTVPISATGVLSSQSSDKLPSDVATTGSSTSSGTTTIGGDIVSIIADNISSSAAATETIDPIIGNIDSINIGGLPSAGSTASEKPDAVPINGPTSNSNSETTGPSDVSSTSVQGPVTSFIDPVSASSDVAATGSGTSSSSLPAGNDVASSVIDNNSSGAVAPGTNDPIIGNIDSSSTGGLPTGEILSTTGPIVTGAAKPADIGSTGAQESSATLPAQNSIKLSSDVTATVPTTPGADTSEGSFIGSTSSAGNSDVNAVVSSVQESVVGPYSSTQEITIPSSEAVTTTGPVDVVAPDVTSTVSLIDVSLNEVSTSANSAAVTELIETGSPSAQESTKGSNEPIPSEPTGVSSTGLNEVEKPVTGLVDTRVNPPVTETITTVAAEEPAVASTDAVISSVSESVLEASSEPSIFVQETPTSASNNSVASPVENIDTTLAAGTGGTTGAVDSNQVSPAPNVIESTEGSSVNSIDVGSSIPPEVGSNGVASGSDVLTTEVPTVNVFNTDVVPNGNSPNVEAKTGSDAVITESSVNASSTEGPSAVTIGSNSPDATVVEVQTDPAISASSVSGVTETTNVEVVPTSTASVLVTDLTFAPETVTGEITVSPALINEETVAPTTEVVAEVVTEQANVAPEVQRVPGSGVSMLILANEPGASVIEVTPQ